MASPQIERGYTRIANELLEHLTKDAKISVGELKILLTVIRKTYGFKKTTDRISLSQFEKSTGYHRANVCRMIKSLVDEKYLLKKENYYKINKNWEQWGVAKRPLVAKQAISSSQTATKTSSQTATHKRKKDIIQKKGPQIIQEIRDQYKGKIKGF